MIAATQSPPASPTSAALRTIPHARLAFARPETEPPRLGAVLKSEPFVGRIVDFACHDLSRGRSDYAVAIPARNEARLLPRCLESMGQAIKATAASGTLVLVVNDTSDKTAELALSWLGANDVPGIVVNVTFDPAIRNAPHARRLALDLAAQFAPGGLLLTSDADSYVAPDWIERASGFLEAGFDLVCDEVRLDQSEAASLPADVERVGELERAYFAACIDLWRLWTGSPDDLIDMRASGAGMAIRASAYAAIGGLPLPRCGEDRALRVLMRERGFRTITSPGCGTRTSARLDARAVGGCGETLRRRALETDPVCDSALVPVARLKAIAEGEGSVQDLHAGPGPMRASELQRQLDIAKALLAEVGLRS
ncbi:glycosyltransferase [Qipengyuania spongiae]|uniref:Glycosyltransferase n=1 Tax=Qipengyuania spongiae TaxID=2909673 RepID=A0ABY5T3M5_9SPHN|nr:glycosyltransferase [Qipengyuania spongiae]UVI39933.1 glycosyltransferase [Qipengyuania spongiae]